jgi:hypothetical protein
MVAPKDQAGRHAYLSEFIEEAMASGLVKQTIERDGLRGVQVAPAGSKGMPSRHMPGPWYSPCEAAPRSVRR